MKINKHKILQVSGFHGFPETFPWPPLESRNPGKKHLPHLALAAHTLWARRRSHSSTGDILSSVPLLTDWLVPPSPQAWRWTCLTFPPPQEKELKSSDAVTYHPCQDRIFSDQTLPSCSGTCSTERLSCNKMSGGWMIIFAIMENTTQTGLNNKRNLLVCDNKKVWRRVGFLQGPIHLFCVVSFCLSTLLHDVNFVLRLSAFKVTTWSPAAGERMQTTFLIVPVKESGSLLPEPVSHRLHISLAHIGKHAIPIKASDTGVRTAGKFRT